MDPKQKNVTEIVVKKINNFLEILKIQSQKNRRETTTSIKQAFSSFRPSTKPKTQN